MHVGGKKKDFDWRVTGMHRAMEAGIDDVGIGVLFGLADWRFEILAMLQHIRELERAYGVGPHTISVPRLEPASGSDMASHPPQPVSDVDFRKIVAILRLAVPYTGMIMSTRETANMRRETFALGVCQISAGSRTNPGGYEEDEEFDAAQFQLGDHRSLDEVIRDVAELGYIPSFCTACYRLGRTGMDFMDLAKPGDIKHHCDPNALSTFLEYLLDYGSAETRAIGETADRDGRSRRWTRCGASSPRRCSRRCAPASATCSAEPARRERTTSQPRPRPRRAIVSDDHIILGIHVTDRLQEARDVQAVFTEYGCNIKTRVGLHDVDASFCSPSGIVLIEFFGDEAAAQAMVDKLDAIEGVHVQKMVFGHP